MRAEGDEMKLLTEIDQKGEEGGHGLVEPSKILQSWCSLVGTELWSEGSEVKLLS